MNPDIHKNDIEKLSMDGCHQRAVTNQEEDEPKRDLEAIKNRNKNGYD